MVAAQRAEIVIVCAGFIGLTRAGNLVGLDAAAWARLPEDEKQVKLKRAEDVLRSSGADFVAEDLPACDSILWQIEALLKNGIRPA
jgi:phosphonoacetaldehyde hydrolase